MVEKIIEKLRTDDQFAKNFTLGGIAFMLVLFLISFL